MTRYLLGLTFVVGLFAINTAGRTHQPYAMIGQEIIETGDTLSSNIHTLPAIFPDGVNSTSVWRPTSLPGPLVFLLAVTNTYCGPPDGNWCELSTRA